MENLELRKSVLIITLFVLLLSCTTKADTESKELQQQALKAMSDATEYMRSISVEGGYLWRYSSDFEIHFGEHEATSTQAWIQFPGTPAMGLTFLKAYGVTQDENYFKAARNVAMALVKGQLQSGGWDYRIEFDQEKRKGYNYRVDKNANAENLFNISTYDDDNTQEAIRYLMTFLFYPGRISDSSDEQIQDALDYGLTKLIEAQYPNGAWPQRWDGKAHTEKDYPIIKASFPEKYPREQPNGSYYGYYTFNDGAHIDNMKTMILAWQKTGRQEYHEAVRKGADFLLLAQLPEPQPIWAQQYDANMHPAWARAFEPPSVTSSESVGIIKTLIDSYIALNDEKYIATIPQALAWYERSKLEDGKWARMYELQTNRPIYGDRDKKIHYTLEEISEERQRGYSWTGEYGVNNLVAYYDSVKNVGAEVWKKSHQPFVESPKRFWPEHEDVESEVKKIIESQDEHGRWLFKGNSRWFKTQGKEWITTVEYIRNMGILCDYIAGKE